ncbi:hypothetical protein SAMN04488094_10462 [Tropicimonas isoalkanivorans]|uniref:Uncharacterized protein n=1 Tax=Tropicimonas isoalkanivorans TaxID=441112 RepID=A0A1I1IEG1_9RHOB|nr:hypothetical protein SAMN04488094_10462 [Tropicimonas isoalkanivorans]
MNLAPERGLPTDGVPLRRRRSGTWKKKRTRRAANRQQTGCALEYSRHMTKSYLRARGINVAVRRNWEPSFLRRKVAFLPGVFRCQVSDLRRSGGRVYGPIRLILFGILRDDVRLSGDVLRNLRGSVDPAERVSGCADGREAVAGVRASRVAAKGSSIWIGLTPDVPISSPRHGTILLLCPFQRPGISIWILTSVGRASTARSKAATLFSKGSVAEISGFRSTLPEPISAIARS